MIIEDHIAPVTMYNIVPYIHYSKPHSIYWVIERLFIPAIASFQSTEDQQHQ